MENISKALQNYFTEKIGGWMAVLKTAISIFIGAFLGVLENLWFAAHNNVNQVNWHEAFKTAAVTGLFAAIMHWWTPPNQNTK